MPRPSNFYIDIYNTRYRLYFSDENGNPKRLDIDQKNYGVSMSEVSFFLSSSSPQTTRNVLYYDRDYNEQELTIVRGATAQVVLARTGTARSSPISPTTHMTITETFKEIIGGSDKIQNIVGTGNPVVIKYNTGELFKKNILASKCSINLYKQFDNEFVNFHEFPENEFKIRIYNGITPFQYHKLRILCPSTSLENQIEFEPSPIIQDPKNPFFNYAERVSAVGNSYICEVDDKVVDNNFDNYATIKNKFINRVVYDYGIIEDEDAVLANELHEFRDSYYQMYWQGYLVANTFKETKKPYPYKISLSALDMLAALENAPVTMYGSDKIPASQNFGTSSTQGNTYDMVDILARYFLNGVISDVFNAASVSYNVYGPSDSLYQYFFIEMDGLNGDNIVANDFEIQNLNLYGFDDRFTYDYSNTAKTNRENVVGQHGLTDENFNLKKAKDVIKQLLDYKNARLYQCYGQIFLSITGTDNGIVGDTPDFIDAEDFTLNSMAQYKKDIKNLMQNPLSNKNKYYKIAYRQWDTDEYGASSDGYKTISYYMGHPAVKVLKRDLVPIRNDFKAEYRPPYKGINIEMQNEMLNAVLSEVGKNPSMEFNGDYILNNGALVLQDNPKSGRKCFKTSSVYFSSSGNYNVLPQNSSGEYIPAIRNTMRSFSAGSTSTTNGFDQLLRVPVGKPKITIKLNYYVEYNPNIGGSTNVPRCRLYYFTNLDTRELANTPAANHDYFYDQNDRRWEKSGRFNFVELESATDYNKYNQVTISVEDWDLYSAQPNGISRVRGEIGYLGLVCQNNISSIGNIYLDNFSIRLDLMRPKEDKLQMINTNSNNTKYLDLKRVPFRAINERDEGKDYKKVLSSITNKFEGDIIKYNTEILNLHSSFVSRYEFTCKDKFNNFGMHNNIYVNFEGDEDDSLSYIDGLQYNVKKNEFKVIAHKGTLQKTNPNNIATFSENT
ncbi:MAG: hypothetical protein Unbinned2072contig1001_40 [Prokaryotic dsDNA virus sp.]|nr:MAG: hypothetical protein Unbinned2072contig1001_40 [Prokaryotic dsDNA virus sp.]|tara:strand:- start:16144 stop:18999 length:2856 start_codon:yes stop_codon:yes gene_type:complete